MSTAQAIEDFRGDVLGREVNREATLSKYVRWAERFERWKPEGDPDEEMLRDFDSFLHDEDLDYPWSNDRGPSPPASYAYNTRIQALSAVKLWARWQYDARIANEVQNICLGEPPEFEPTVLSPTEVNRILNDAPFACDNPDCNVALKVGYDAILRGAELADLRLDDVNRDERRLKVRGKKGSNTLELKLAPDITSALLRHVESHPDREYLFYNAYGRSWKPSALNNHIRRKHCPAGSHALFRHSAITNRLRQGERFGDVFVRARHQQPQTTLKYVSIAGVEAPSWVDAV